MCRLKKQFEKVSADSKKIPPCDKKKNFVEKTQKSSATHKSKFLKDLFKPGNLL